MLNFFTSGAIAEGVCYMTIQEVNIDAVVRAIENDADGALSDLAQALVEAKAGLVGRITTPEQMLVRQARERCGLTAVPTAALAAVLVAVELIVESGVPSAEHVENVLARLNAGPVYISQSDTFGCAAFDAELRGVAITHSALCA